jgi:multisubunit Na+/H+ antiporter MnhG subunit
MSSSAASAGYVTFLFGVFCAYWAQTTSRNPWLWFFFGWVLAPVAGLVLLWKNANDRPMPRNLDERGRDDLLAVRKDVP